MIGGALLLVLVGLIAGKAWAASEDPTVTKSAPTVPVVHARLDAFAWAQATDRAAAMLAEQVRQEQARAATEAQLVDLGWVAGTCEPETPGVPLIGTLPVCPTILPSIDHWLAIHNCEQPPGTGQGWATVGVFGNGLAGGGGMGISNAAWSAWGGLAYAPYPGAASPWAQMVVASVGWGQYGASPWGCRID